MNISNRCIHKFYLLHLLNINMEKIFLKNVFNLVQLTTGWSAFEGLVIYFTVRQRWACH